MHNTQETSREAFERAQDYGLNRRQKIVLDCIAASGSAGQTRRELEYSTGFLTQTLCPILNHLESQDVIAKRTSEELGGTLVKRDGCAVYVLAGPYLN